MLSNKYRTIDPHEIQRRFSMDDHTFENFEGKSFHFDDFIPYISKLPQREIDLIDMYFKKEKKQKEIADFFGVTQGAVSHRIKRAKKRLLFLRDMPKVNLDIIGALSKYFNDVEISLIQIMIETTCQSKTADLLNIKYKLEGKNVMTQVKVRHKFDRYLKRLEDIKATDETIEGYYNLILYIKNNLYMLHEVKLPHFDKGFHVTYYNVL